jgi:hypothetical protein
MRRRSTASEKGVQKEKRDPTIAWLVSPEKEVNQAMVESLSVSKVRTDICFGYSGHRMLSFTFTRRDALANSQARRPRYFVTGPAGRAGVLTG